MTIAPDEAFQLSDRYRATDGDVLVTGIQALARVPLDQLRADKAAGLRTSAFISGYQGSPLGGYDRELLANQKLLDEFGVVLRPGVNEELAATSVAGSQLVNTRPDAKFDGVTGYWYGKAPGLERAADAIRHANFIGTSEHGGVLALIGDDPANKSSTVPSRSDAFVAALGFPLLDPGTMQDILDLGRHGVAMSRASRLWVGLRVVTAVADGTGQANVDPTRLSPIVPVLETNGEPWKPVFSGFTLGGTSLAQELELFGPRMEVALRYIEANGINQEIVASGNAWLTIVASGYTAELVLGALKALGLDERAASDLGVRVLKLRAVHPFDVAAVRASAKGVGTVLVVEEKRAFIETLVRDALYASAERPNVIGKRDASGQPLVGVGGALSVEQLVEPLRRVLLTNISAERLIPQRVKKSLPFRVADEAVRTPYFCSGCPHNSSTVVPDGSLVGVGIGCHGMVSSVEHGNRGEFTSITQMGGEGLHWVGMAPFVETPHLFQNIGDGTFFHSGQLAIQAAMAAGVNVTYKLLFNAAVAMTGGQDATGLIPVHAVAAKLIAEGVKEVVITTDETSKYKDVALAERVSVRDRDDIIAVQEHLRTVPGVTVLIHDQQCAAEKRRDRKRGLLPTPTTRVVIDHRVCEGCGDCGIASNCLSLEPVDTEFGRKTRIDQTSCNVDRSCIKGDCPAFVTVTPGKGSRKTVPASGFEVPDPAMVVPSEGITLRMPGIGGTGVVTVSQMLLAAARIDGVQATAVDQTGLSQKGGPVVSTLTIGSPIPSRVHVLIGCDLLTSVTPSNVEGLDPEWSHVVASTTVTPTGRMVGRVASVSLDTMPYRNELDGRSQASTNRYANASAITTGILGSAITANTFLLGVAYQSGLIPISANAIERAIELNGTAVVANQAAFNWGRRWAVDSAGVEALAFGHDERPADRSGLDGFSWAGDDVVNLIARRRRELTDYQSGSYARSFVDVVRRASDAERAAGGDGSFTRVVAHQLARVMAYKDEYEVARLLSSGHERLEQALGQPVEAATFNLHPPMLRSMGMKKKLKFSGPVAAAALKPLVPMKRLRGTAADPFGRAHVRKEERALIVEYTKLIDSLLGLLDTDPAEAVRVAGLVDQVRGFEDVKMRNLAAYRKALAELGR